MKLLYITFLIHLIKTEKECDFKFNIKELIKDSPINVICKPIHLEYKILKTKRKIKISSILNCFNLMNNMLMKTFLKTEIFLGLKDFYFLVTKKTDKLENFLYDKDKIFWEISNKNDFEGFKFEKSVSCKKMKYIFRIIFTKV